MADAAVTQTKPNGGTQMPDQQHQLDTRAIEIASRVEGGFEAHLKQHAISDASSAADRQAMRDSMESLNSSIAESFRRVHDRLDKMSFRMMAGGGAFILFLLGTIVTLAMKLGEKASAP